jgi:hypothetical protein
VWNDCDSHRVVLSVDPERRLSLPASVLNRAIIRVIARSSSVAEPMDRVRKYGRAAQKTSEANDKGIAA